MFKLPSAIIAATIFVSSAHAADFTGPRIEVRGGWDRVTGKFKYTDSAIPANNFSEKESTDDIVYGVGIGYDFALSETFIAGIHAGIDFADNKKCAEVYGDDAACFKTRRDIEVGGRLGAVVSPMALFYVSGSYVNGGGKISYTDDLDPTNNFSYKDEKGGIRVGVGMEYAFGSRAYGKIEYRYSNYSNFTEQLSATEDASLGFDRNQVVAGIGFRF